MSIITGFPPVKKKNHHRSLNIFKIYKNVRMAYYKAYKVICGMFYDHVPHF